MAYRTGDRVRQQTYGVGDIIEVRGPYVTIAFDDLVTRKFIASMVLLEPSLVPRPPRPEPVPRKRATRSGLRVGQGAAARPSAS